MCGFSFRCGVLLALLPGSDGKSSSVFFVFFKNPASFPELAVKQTQAGADPGTFDAAFAGEPHPVRGGPLRQHVPPAGACGSSLHPAGCEEAVDRPQHGDAPQVRLDYLPLSFLLALKKVHLFTGVST